MTDTRASPPARSVTAAVASAYRPVAQGNTLLETLNRTDARWSTHRFRALSFKRGDVLAETGRPIDQVLFVTGGLISLVVELSSGDRVEVGILGHHNVLGAAAAFGQRMNIVNAVAQIPGTALSLSAQDFADLTERNAAARALLHTHEQFLRAQAHQIAACNAKHHIPARLATWLLRVRDATGSGTFDITQEFVAGMLGVQRASISLVASSLQDQGLLQYRRGHVKILNEHGLMTEACECYRALERTHRLLFESKYRDAV